MLDYAYEDVQYYEWIGDVIKYAYSNYNAEVDLLAEDNAFVCVCRRSSDGSSKTLSLIRVGQNQLINHQ